MTIAKQKFSQGKWYQDEFDWGWNNVKQGFTILWKARTHGRKLMWVTYFKNIIYNQTIFYHLHMALHGSKILILIIKYLTFKWSIKSWGSRSPVTLKRRIFTTFLLGLKEWEKKGRLKNLDNKTPWKYNRGQNFNYF